MKTEGKKRALYSGQPEEGRWMNKNLNSSVSGFGFYCTHARYTLSYVLPWNLAQLLQTCYRGLLFASAKSGVIRAGLTMI